MNRKNTTLNALFMSVVSLLLCVSMFVGTTFAWFTDSVESGVNVINAGNLDVELYHDNGAEKVDGQTDLFNLDEVDDQHDLWEPGAVAYENFIVKNEGNLALKYQLAMNFTGATKNAKGRTLADVLKVAVVEGGFNGTREDAKKLNYNQSLSTFTLSGELAEHNDSDTYGIVIYWEPTENDNDFNMKNVEKNEDGSAVNTLKIDLGVSLFATQLTHEDDSFDNTYDEDASLTIPEIKVETPTTDAFLAALTAGETAVLTADLAIEDDFYLEAGTTAAIDLNGNTLTVGANGGIAVEGNLILTGTGTVAVTAGEGATYVGLLVDEGATMELGEGVTIATESNSIGVHVLGDLIVNGATIDASAGGHGIFTFESGDTNITVNSGSVLGNSAIYIGWQTNANIVIGEGATVDKIVGGYGGTTANITYYGDTALDIADDAAATIYCYNIRNVYTQEELDGAITACANEIILSEGSFELSGDNKIVIVGSGADTVIDITGTINSVDISNATVTGLNYLNAEAGDSINFTNVVFDGQFGHVDQSVINGDAEFVGCTFNGGLHIDKSAADSEIVFEDCTFTELCYIKLGGSAHYKFDGCVIEALNTEKVTSPWGRQWVISYGDVTMTNCQIGRVLRAGKQITFTLNNCVDANSKAVTSAIVHSNASPFVVIDGVTYVSSADALATAVANGATNLYLLPGEYDVYGCANKTLTINGTKDAVIKVMNDGEDGCDYAFGLHGLGDVTFNGVTIDTTSNTGNYKGFAYMKGTFNNCNFVGAYSLNNANDFEFNNCTFDFQNGYFWTWGANSVTFNDCTFNGNSKCILAHGYASTVINIADCTFAATEQGYTGSGDNTAAVEIDPAGSNTYTVTFTGENTITDAYAGWTRIKDGSTGHTITTP